MNNHIIMIKRQKNIWYELYLIVACIYAVYRVITATYIENLIFFPVNKLYIVNYVCIIGLIISFFGQTKITYKRLIISFIIAIIIGIISYFSFDMPSFITFIFILTYPAGLSLKILARRMFWCYFIVIPVIVLAALNGIIKDYTIYQRVLRHSCGFVTPNTFSNYVTITVMLKVYYKFDEWKVKNSFVWMVILIVLYNITNSRLAFLSGMLMIVLAHIFKLIKSNKFKRYLYNISSVLFSILSIICVWATIYFSNHKGILYTEINLFFTGRLTWLTYYYETYGIKLFGQKIVTVSRAVAEETGISWQNIDNAYVLIIIRFGIIFLIGMMIVYFLLGKYLKRDKNLVGAIYVVVICVIGITENFLLHAGMNFTIFMVAEMIASKPILCINKRIHTPKS